MELPAQARETGCRTGLAAVRLMPVEADVVGSGCGEDVLDVGLRCAAAAAVAQAVGAHGLGGGASQPALMAYRSCRAWVFCSFRTRFWISCGGWGSRRMCRPRPAVFPVQSRRSSQGLQRARGKSTDSRSCPSASVGCQGGMVAPCGQVSVFSSRLGWKSCFSKPGSDRAPGPSLTGPTGSTPPDHLPGTPVVGPPGRGVPRRCGRRRCGPHRPGGLPAATAGRGKGGGRRHACRHRGGAEALGELLKEVRLVRNTVLTRLLSRTDGRDDEVIARPAGVSPWPWPSGGSGSPPTGVSDRRGGRLPGGPGPQGGRRRSKSEPAGALPRLMRGRPAPARRGCVPGPGRRVGRAGCRCGRCR